MGLRMTLLLLLLQVPQKGTKNDDFGKTFVKMKQQNKVDWVIDVAINYNL